MRPRREGEGVESVASTLGQGGIYNAPGGINIYKGKIEEQSPNTF